MVRLRRCGSCGSQEYFALTKSSSSNAAIVNLSQANSRVSTVSYSNVDKTVGNVPATCFCNYSNANCEYSNKKSKAQF